MDAVADEPADGPANEPEVGVATLRTADGLTPIQRRTLDTLRRSDRPIVFDETFVAGLRSDAAAAVDAFGARLGDNVLFVNKRSVAGVLDCEAHHMAPDHFAWSPARARGQVAHKAIQLLLNWRGEPVPADLVDEAIARLAETETGLGDWLAGLGPADEADLRGQAVERVTKFLECFPPLDRRWHPMTEASALWPLDGPIVMRAKVDLMIGRPSGPESRKVIVDLKAGRIVAQHREDLRFYALVETLCRDVPPRMLATLSLDSGRAATEEVTEGVLRSALRRVLDAIDRMVQLVAEGRPPTRSPGTSCRWCPLADGCAEGTAWLAGERGEGDDVER